MLDQLIEYAQIQGHIDTECVFAGDWHMPVSAQKNVAIIHIVTEGQGWLKRNENDAIQIHTGDILFFPHGSAHQFSNQAHFSVHEYLSSDIKIQQQNAFFQRKTNTENDPNLNLFCAHFNYTNQAILFKNLPEYIHIHLQAELILPLVSLLKKESAETGMGSFIVINAISEVILVQVLRHYLKDTAEDDLYGLFKGWKSSPLKNLIEKIIAEPEHPWSLEMMYKEINVSRIQLIRLFKKYLAVTPHRFLIEIRLQAAALQLKKSNLSVLAIAMNFGFQSETHFGRIFKQYYGLSPSQYRK